MTNAELDAIEATCREVVTNCPDPNCHYCVSHQQRLALVAEVRRLNGVVDHTKEWLLQAHQEVRKLRERTGWGK